MLLCNSRIYTPELFKWVGMTEMGELVNLPALDIE